MHSRAVLCIDQIGRGNRVPGEVELYFKSKGISCQCFRFCKSMDSFIRHATLIISHAGAGSIIESLSAKNKPYVVVSESFSSC